MAQPTLVRAQTNVAKGNDKPRYMAQKSQGFGIDEENSQTMRTTDKLHESVNACYGDFVELVDGRLGTIRYVGTPNRENSLVWYGISLSSPTGQHNGTQHGITYWKDESNHGIFVKPNQIVKIVKEKADGSRLNVNDIVKHKQKGNGMIRYVGELWNDNDNDNNNSGNDVTYGIELLDNSGQNNGFDLKTQTFVFLCTSSNHGLFCNENDLTLIEKSKVIDYIDCNDEAYDSESDLSDNDEKEFHHSNQNSTNTTDSECDSDGNGNDWKYHGYHEYEADISPLNENIDTDNLPIQTTNLNTAKSQEETFQHLLTQFKNHGNRGKNNKDVLKLEAKENDDNMKEEKEIDMRHSDNNNGDSSVKAKTRENRSVTAPKAPSLKKGMKTFDIDTIAESNATEKRDSPVLFRQESGSMELKSSETDLAHHDPAVESIETTSNKDDNNNNNNNNNKNNNNSNNNSPDFTDELFNIVSLESLMSQGSISNPRSRNNTVSVASPRDSGNKATALFGAGGGSSNNSGHGTPTHMTGRSNRSRSVLATNASCHVSNWILDFNDKSQGMPAKLKQCADTPFDVATTKVEFEYCCESVMLACNNPEKLFKVLHRIASKLYYCDEKYRCIDTKEAVARLILWRYEGVLDFLRLLGFKPQNNEDASHILILSKNQPPLNVLNSAVQVCDQFLQRCKQKQEKIAFIKRYSTTKIKKLIDYKRASMVVSNNNLNNNINNNNNNNNNINNSSNRVWCNKGKIDENFLQALQLPGDLKLDEDDEDDDEDSAHMPEPLELPADGMTLSLTNHDSNKQQLQQHRNSVHRKHKNSPSLRFGASPTSARVLPCHHGRQASSNNDSIDLTSSVTGEERDWSAATGSANADSEERKLESEMDADGDIVQLNQIVWSITEKTHRNGEIKEVLLLAYGTFTTPSQLLQSIEARYFENDLSVSILSPSNVTPSNNDHNVGFFGENFDEKSENGINVKDDKIRAPWDVQVQCVNLLQHWMRAYWIEDFISSQENLANKMGQFIERAKNAIKRKNNNENDNDNNSNNMTREELLISKLENTYQSCKSPNESGKECEIYQGNSQYRHHRTNTSETLSLSNNSSNNNSNKKFSMISKKTPFIKLDNEIIAQQITFMDHEKFANITRRECLSQGWKKDNKWEIAPNICKIIERFNNISRWVQCTILNASNDKAKGYCIKKFIKIGNQLFFLRNLQSLCAIYGALNSTPIQTLTNAWNQVKRKHITKFEEMKTLFSGHNNMANLRKLHREAQPPMIPYSGLFLKDLVAVECGQNKRKRDGTVNFARLLRLSEKIEKTLMYQNTPYNIKEDKNVCAILLNEFQIYNDKTETDIYQMSNEYKINQPKKKKRSKSRPSKAFSNIKRQLSHKG